MSNAQEDSGDNFTVPPPFDSSSPGDCILQSADDVQFKVFRQILILASPVMADMFSLPQNDAKTESNGAPPHDLPLISVAEDAETIRNLLLLLYPTSFPDGLEVDAAIKLAKVYDKYLIPKARLRLAIGPLYASKSTLGNHPLELYRLALELEMMSEAATASRFTHKIGFKDLYTALPMDVFEKLLDFRKRREEGLDNLIAVIEPRKSICGTHASQDSDFFRQIAALKNLVRESIQDPFPEERDASEFFRVRPTYPAADDPDSNPTWGRRRCSCFGECDWVRMTTVLRLALQRFPQCI